MTESHELKNLMKALKRLLKEKGISYRELGRHLGITESGVKKIFASQDASFQRLAQIAHVLGLKIFDILEDIQQSTFENVQFSPEQQEQFLKDPLLFPLFCKLVIERTSAEDARTELGLSEQKFFSCLRRLDELNLIQLFAENKIKIPPVKMVRDFGDGPFMRQLYAEWGHALVEDLAKPPLQSSGQFIVRCLKMKEETYAEFLSRLRDVEAEFTRRGIREMSVSLQGLKMMRWMSLTDQRSFIRPK